MRHILFLLFMALTLQAIAQYPATGNKMRLGWQTTGDGLVYRGAIGDTATLDPSGINNAWMLLDTANGNLYAYWIKAWRLVSGGGGGGVTMPFDSVTFNVNEDDASERELKYSEEKGYLQYGGLDSVQIPLLPGIWYVRNDTSVTIPKGRVVRATGTLGASGRIKVKHMIANGTIDAMYVLGIAMQDIAVGADGYVMTQGKIRQVNTQAYSEGAVLYADVDTLGGLTQTEPTGSNLKLPIAFVVHSASNGTLAVRVSPGTYLRDLHDAYITSPVSNASLYYNASESVWRDTGAAVLVADTAAMLSSYISNADTATMLSSYISNADTSVFARDFQISGTANRLTMFTGSNTVGNAPMSVDGDTLNIITNAGFPTFRYNRDFSISSNTFAGWPVGTRFYSLLNSTSSASVSFGDGTNGTVQNQAFMQLTSWTGGGANYYSSRLINNNTGDLGFYLSSLGSNANPTMSATPHLMILNGGNVGIATSSPSRPLHVAGTTAIRIPVGTTSDRGTSANGDLRYSTTFNNIEFYDGSRGLWERPLVGTVANNKVAFASGDTLTSNTNFHWDNATTKLGIGNAAPDSTLTVTGGIRATTGVTAARFTATGSTVPTNGMYLPATNALAFSTNSTERMRILSDGKVGINVTPTEQLQVGGTVRATRLSVNTFGSQVVSINNFAPTGADGGNLFIGNGGASLTLGGGASTNASSNLGIGFGALQSNTTASLNLAIGGDALIYTTTGSQNIGIGQGAGAFLTTGAGNTFIGRAAGIYDSTSSYNIGIGAYALSSVGIGGASNENIAIGNSAGENLRAGSYNNVMIGASAAKATAASAVVTSLNSSVYIGNYTTPSATTGVSNEIAIGYQTAGKGSNTTTIGNSSTTKTFFQYGETYIGTATDNGEFALQVGGTGYFSTGLRVDYTAAFDANTIFQMPNTSTKAAKGYAWNTYSDARIKSNFDTIQNALQAVQALKPVYYDQHDSEVIDGKIKLQDGKTRTVGFIAQDVAPVIPAAVQAGNDTQLWGMDYAKLIPYLTKAIQEQQAQIEALKKEIEALKNK